MTVNYPPYSDEYLADILTRRTRDKDAPLDFTTLPLNGFGLYAYEYPPLTMRRSRSAPMPPSARMAPR